MSLKTAVILCGVFEFLGATCLGSGVSSTIQKGVSKIDNPSCWACGYCNAQTSVYMSGMMGALIGASFFLIIASTTSLPVSTTHAIVGGVVGMTVGGAGGNCLNWAINGGLGGIVLSWVISPVLSGLIAVVFYALSRRFIIKRNNPQYLALALMPVLFSLSTFILVLVTMLKAKAIKKMIDINTKLIISSVCAALVGLFAHFLVRPEVEKTFPSTNNESKNFFTKSAIILANSRCSTLEGDPDMQSKELLTIVEAECEVSVSGTGTERCSKNTTEDITATKEVLDESNSVSERVIVPMDLLKFPINDADTVEELDAI